MRKHKEVPLIFLLSIIIFSETDIGRAESYLPSNVALNPFLSQQARFTNVQYNIYPGGYQIQVPLITEGNIKAGPLLVHPHFGIAELYTDNVFRTDKTFGGRQAEWYTAYQPGLQIQLPVMGRHKIVVDYMGYLERYSKDSTLNVNDQTMSFQPIFEFPGGLTIRLLGELKDGHDYRGSATANILPGADTSSTINKFYNVEYGGELRLQSQAYVLAQLKSIRWQFTGPLAGSRAPGTLGDINTRNRQESYASLAAGSQIAPKTYLFIQGLLQKEHYEVNKDLDSTTYTGALGITWEATAKSTGNFSIGWQNRIMDRFSTRGSGTFSGLYFNGNLLWQPQEQTRITWGVYRRTNETVLGDTRFYVSTGTTFDFVHAFTKKWSFVGQVMFEHDNYSDPIFADGKREDRQDNYTTLGGGLIYQIQPWLGVRLNYLYTERLSNFVSVQYNANQAMLSVQAQF